MAKQVTALTEGQDALQRRALDLERRLSSDVLGIFGVIRSGTDESVRDRLESFAKEKKGRARLAVVLSSSGGLVEVAERIVTVQRHFYKEVAFYVTDVALSAATVLAMSGDQIWMDYFSCLGPIDPQVDRAGNFVPALSYLSQYDRLVAKAQANKITEAEFLIMKGFDQAELHLYEKARDLSVSLLKGWLAQYKFKDWTTTETAKTPVTPAMRVKRAEEVAKLLMDHERWGSHGRGIGMKILREEVKLKIDDFGTDAKLAEALRGYSSLALDFMGRVNWGSMTHGRMP